MFSKTSGHGTNEILDKWNLFPYEMARHKEICLCLNMVFGVPVLTLINYTLKEQGIGEWVIPFWEGQQHEYFSLNSVAKSFT